MLQSPSPHVVVDSLPTDPWSVVAAIAAIVAAIVGVIAMRVALDAFNQARSQTKLAEDTLQAAKDELKLASDQLSETRAATKQTEETLRLGQGQLRYLQKADVDRDRSLAPRITASMKLNANGDRFIMQLSNSGALASYVQVTGRDSASQFHSVFVQKIDPSEGVQVPEFFVLPSSASWCQMIRIRAYDIRGNKYITEYRSLGETLAYPVFRIPWLGREIEPRPERCSDEVSWEVEHFERLPGRSDEPKELDFDIEAPA
ncbi:MAG TPA: hypothetical protein VMD91_06425 [Candidatus Sulfotelmatobacter sp.]|nr:hypothetical protein [Candidatus Sulfotelmatobacter sp.]